MAYNYVKHMFDYPTWGGCLMQDREDLKSGTDSREEIDNRSRNTENSSSYVENITHRKPESCGY